MKKVFFLFSLTLILAGYGFSQNNLTPDQIRRHANELGVPYEALQRLVDSHRVQTGLSNPNAGGARLVSVRELDFMRASNMLEVGSYYRIRAFFFNQSGRSVTFYTESGYNRDHLFNVDTSFLVNIPGDTAVDALLSVRAGEYGGQELFLVEISLVR